MGISGVGHVPPVSPFHTPLPEKPFLVQLIVGLTVVGLPHNSTRRVGERRFLLPGFSQFNRFCQAGDYYHFFMTSTITVYEIFLCKHS